ncbi:hypothetical protein [Salipiger sp. CCB-MM3]|uniref:hypothetical protein n=1 Tax=Salipiger sp. CCB-MM3 TaxID=1792508 RepID=UPI0012F80E24|nr:hypothetical protein [Salipiger sp. CCB-MM3]
MAEDTLDAVMADASARIRCGDDVRTALWRSVRHLWEAELFEDFEVDRTHGDFAWPLVMSAREDDFDRVSQALAHAKALAVSAVTVVTESSTEDFWGLLDVPCPDDRCIYCGLALSYEPVAEGAPSLHARCQPVMGTLKSAIFESALRLERENSGVSQAADERRDDVHEPEETVEQVLVGVESLLSHFKGELYTEQVEPSV